jgi:hypothetical protein
MVRVVDVLKVPSQFHDGGPEKSEGSNHYIRIWNWAVKLPGGGVRPRAEAIQRLIEVAIHHHDKTYRRHALTLLKTRFGVMLAHITGELPWGEKPTVAKGWVTLPAGQHVLIGGEEDGKTEVRNIPKLDTSQTRTESAIEASKLASRRQEWAAPKGKVDPDGQPMQEGRLLRGMSAAEFERARETGEFAHRIGGRLSLSNWSSIASSYAILHDGLMVNNKPVIVEFDVRGLPGLIMESQILSEWSVARIPFSRALRVWDANTGKRITADKSEKGWVTLPDGRRVLIGGAPREVSQVRLPKRPPIGLTGRTEEDQKRIDERQTMISAMAEKLGFPGDKIIYEDRPGSEFDLAGHQCEEAGHFEPNTGLIRIFSNAFGNVFVFGFPEPERAEKLKELEEKNIGGIVAHEVTHAQFDTVVKAMNGETRAAFDEEARIRDRYQHGEFDKPSGGVTLEPGKTPSVSAEGIERPPYRDVSPVLASGEITEVGKDKYPVAYGWQKVVGEYAPKLERDILEAYRRGATYEQSPHWEDKFAKEDGITNYSSEWWDSTRPDPTSGARATATSFQAMNETLAEWNRIELTERGGMDSFRKGWMDQKRNFQRLYTYVQRAYEKIQKAKVAPGRPPS